MTVLKTLAPLATLLLAAGGCGGNLAYVHNASIGVDLIVSTEGSGKLHVGYDNETFAIVPRFDPVGDGKHGDAMTLVSVSNVDIDGLEEVVFNHVVATGQSARNVADDAEGLRILRAAVFGVEAAKK